ncbi:MAG: hypothetical protein K2Q18_07790 [Bdellovibrionales bacterium]|nr:hypothetical protein [Bdellovibrionales bacterium]
MKKLLLALCLIIGFQTVSEVKAQDMSFGEDSYENVLDQGVASFCRDRLAVMRTAYRRAQIESSRGNAQLSAEILLNGLKQAALQIGPRYSNTLTAKAITRGVRLVAALQASTNDRQKVRSINYFLNSYYNFVERVSRDLDVPYFQPGRCGFCNANDEFEQNFITFAKEQLEMVLGSMTTDNRGIIYPVGSPRVLLTAIKVTSINMAADLSESLWATRFACTIRELQDISIEAGSYLKGTSYAANDFEAIQELVSRSRNAADSIGGCY